LAPRSHHHDHTHFIGQTHAPFSLILLGVITTQIGALQTVPVTIAVITAYLAVSGSGLLIALAQRQRKPAASDA
jgi:hypothetical protein